MHSWVWWWCGDVGGVTFACGTVWYLEEALESTWMDQLAWWYHTATATKVPYGMVVPLRLLGSYRALQQLRSHVRHFQLIACE